MKLSKRSVLLIVLFLFYVGLRFLVKEDLALVLDVIWGGFVYLLYRFLGARPKISLIFTFFLAIFMEIPNYFEKGVVINQESLMFLCTPVIAIICVFYIDRHFLGDSDLHLLSKI